MSSAGLRVMLLIAQKSKQTQKRVVIAGLSEEILEVMEMTGFSEMFEKYKTIDEALKIISQGNNG